MTSKGGFYSAVKNKTIKPGEIMVRGRRRDDLERLIKAIGSDVDVISTPGSDYAFRVIIPVEAWAQYLYDSALDINYDNFKDASCKGDHERHEAYMDVWVALLGLQRRA
jgi:hypothetical protein